MDMTQKNNKLVVVHMDVRKLKGKPDTNLPSFSKAKLEKLIEEAAWRCARSESCERATQRFSPSNDTMLTTVTRRRTIDEASTFNSAQYAPTRGEWKTFEAHRESARLDTERC
jgi:hypothetical protein